MYGKKLLSASSLAQFGLWYHHCGRMNDVADVSVPVGTDNGLEKQRGSAISAREIDFINYVAGLGGRYIPR